jgi:hypothetical protein
MPPVDDCCPKRPRRKPYEHLLKFVRDTTSADDAAGEPVVTETTYLRTRGNVTPSGVSTETVEGMQKQNFARYDVYLPYSRTAAAIGKTVKEVRLIVVTLDGIELDIDGLGTYVGGQRRELRFSCYQRA